MQHCFLSVFLICMSVVMRMGIQVPAGAAKESQIPWTWSLADWDLAGCGCWDPSSGPLEKQWAGS